MIQSPMIAMVRATTGVTKGVMHGQRISPHGEVAWSPAVAACGQASKRASRASDERC
jgi:hypothetical protein